MASVNAKLFQTDPHFTAAEIFSGYRTEAGERKVSGKTTGAHRRGCAIDIIDGTWSKWTCSDACEHVLKSGGSLKVTLPYHGKVEGEENHLEPTSSCNGGTPNDPSPYTPSPYTSSPYRPPTTPITSMFAQQTCPPGYILYGNMCYPQQVAQQPIPTAYQPNRYFMPPITATNASPSPPTSPIVTTNTNVNTNTNVIDAISNIAGNIVGSSTNATGTPAAISLIQALGNISNLSAGSSSSATSSSNFALAPTQQNTFRSQDLGQAPSIQTFQGNSITFNFLEKLKQILLWMLNFLRPLSKNAPPPEEYYENGH